MALKSTVHAIVARFRLLAAGDAQRQTLRLRLLPRLLARQRHRRCSPLLRYCLLPLRPRATHSAASSAVAK